MSNVTYLAQRAVGGVVLLVAVLANHGRAREAHVVLLTVRAIKIK